MVNTAQQPIKDCEIHINENPDTMVYWRNWFTAPFNQRWVIIIRIYTTSEKMARFIQQKWLAKTRGIQRYISKAFYLAKPLEESGKGCLEITPWSLEHERKAVNQRCLNGQLDWPPLPIIDTIQKVISPSRTLVSEQNQGKLPADYIRMYDIQQDSLKTIPLQVLEKFIHNVSQ